MEYMLSKPEILYPLKPGISCVATAMSVAIHFRISQLSLLLSIYCVINVRLADLQSSKFIYSRFTIHIYGQDKYCHHIPETLIQFSFLILQTRICGQDKYCHHIQDSHMWSRQNIATIFQTHICG